MSAATSPRFCARSTGLQTAARENVATPADWVPGQDVVVPVAVSDADAIAKVRSDRDEASLPADGEAAG
jgi:hypothetical protein